MSFASILSEPTEDTPPPRRASPPPPLPPSQPIIRTKEPEPAPVLPLPRLEKKPSQEPAIVEREREEKILLPPRENGLQKQEKAPPVVQARVIKAPRLTQKEAEAIERKVAEIDKAEKSDVEDETGFEAELKLYIAKSKKRAMEADILESHKIKVCRLVLSDFDYIG